MSHLTISRDSSVPSLSVRSCNGFMHMKFTQSADGRFVLGENSPPFATIPEVIHYYTTHKLPIRGAEHMSLLYPVIVQTLWHWRTLTVSPGATDNNIYSTFPCFCPYPTCFFTAIPQCHMHCFNETGLFGATFPLYHNPIYFESVLTPWMNYESLFDGFFFWCFIYSCFIYRN